MQCCGFTIYYLVVLFVSCLSFYLLYSYSSTHHICIILAGIFSWCSYCWRIHERTPCHWFSSASACIPNMQKPALSSPHLKRGNTENHRDISIQLQGAFISYLGTLRLPPDVLLVHVGEALQASVACVKGFLEVLFDHHLLCSGVQHAGHLC